MSLIEIDSGIPMPASVRKGSGPRKYPWTDMEVGDSIFVAKDKGQFSSLARKACPDAKFSQRSVVENDIPGMRVWRVA